MPSHTKLASWIASWLILVLHVGVIYRCQDAQVPYIDVEMAEAGCDEHSLVNSAFHTLDRLCSIACRRS